MLELVVRSIGADNKITKIITGGVLQFDEGAYIQPNARDSDRYLVIRGTGETCKIPYNANLKIEIWQDKRMIGLVDVPDFLDEFYRIFFTKMSR